MSGQLLHFVRLKTYERSRSGVLSDGEEEVLEWLIRLNPEAGSVIRRSGGFRKIRIGIGGRGKRGGARVIYYFIKRSRRVYLTLAYAKNVTDDLTQGELKALKQIAAALDAER